jgi:hypothetical protein
MRIALIVGIDYYAHGNALSGCVNDARAVNSVLAHHANASKNFDCELHLGSDSVNCVLRSNLKDRIEYLFRTEAEIALFYFAGHGYIESTGGFLLTSDSRRGDEGISLNDILMLANQSPANNKIIVLDSCHSGIIGTIPAMGDTAILAEGLTVLTASTKDQYATEENGRGIFTSLFVDALNGGASSITGDITPGGIYAHIDQSLNAWQQRPVFKTNIKQFVSLRKVEPSISLLDLRQITELFPSSDSIYPLYPTYEPEMKGRDPDMPAPNKENNEKFAILQKYNRLNLLVPVNAPHMWHAAMQKKSCKLTALGCHYWRLVANGRV